MATVKELRAKAKAYGIKGYSKMDKKTLENLTSQKAYEVYNALHNQEIHETTSYEDEIEPRELTPRQREYFSQLVAVVKAKGTAALSNSDALIYVSMRSTEVKFRSKQAQTILEHPEQIKENVDKYIDFIEKHGEYIDTYYEARIYKHLIEAILRQNGKEHIPFLWHFLSSNSIYASDIYINKNISPREIANRLLLVNDDYKEKEVKAVFEDLAFGDKNKTTTDQTASPASTVETTQPEVKHVPEIEDTHAADNQEVSKPAAIDDEAFEEFYRKRIEQTKREQAARMRFWAELWAEHEANLEEDYHWFTKFDEEYCSPDYQENRAVLDDEPEPREPDTQEIRKEQPTTPKFPKFEAGKVYMKGYVNCSDPELKAAPEHGLVIILHRNGDWITLAEKGKNSTSMRRKVRECILPGGEFIRLSDNEKTDIIYSLNEYKPDTVSIAPDEKISQPEPCKDKKPNSKHLLPRLETCPHCGSKHKQSQQEKIICFDYDDMHGKGRLTSQQFDEICEYNAALLEKCATPDEMRILLAEANECTMNFMMNCIRDYRGTTGAFYWGYGEYVEYTHDEMVEQLIERVLYCRQSRIDGEAREAKAKALKYTPAPVEKTTPSATTKARILENTDACNETSEQHAHIVNKPITNTASVKNVRDEKREGQKFHAGITYSFGINVKVSCTIHSRTKSRAIISCSCSYGSDKDKPHRVKIFTNQDKGGEEYLYPIGRYSMAPICRACNTLDIVQFITGTYYYHTDAKGRIRTYEVLKICGEIIYLKEHYIDGEGHAFHGKIEIRDNVEHAINYFTNMDISADKTTCKPAPKQATIKPQKAKKTDDSRQILIPFEAEPVNEVKAKKPDTPKPSRKTRLKLDESRQLLICFDEDIITSEDNERKAA